MNSGRKNTESVKKQRNGNYKESQKKGWICRDVQISQSLTNFYTVWPRMQVLIIYIHHNMVAKN